MTYIYTLKITISVSLFLYRFVNKIKFFNSCVVRVGFYLEFVVVSTHTSFCWSFIITLILFNIDWESSLFHLVCRLVSSSVHAKSWGRSVPRIWCGAVKFLSRHAQWPKRKRDYSYNLLQKGSIYIMTKFENSASFLLFGQPSTSIHQENLSFSKMLSKAEEFENIVF